MKPAAARPARFERPAPVRKNKSTKGVSGGSPAGTNKLEVEERRAPNSWVPLTSCPSTAEIRLTASQSSARPPHTVVYALGSGVVRSQGRTSVTPLGNSFLASSVGLRGVNKKAQMVEEPQ